MKIIDALAQVKNNIFAFEQKYGRPRGSVSLLAVSKTRTLDEIRQAAGVGQYYFGENYCQEAIAKIKHLAPAKLSWHFIGTIQSNKTQQIAQYFDWAHTVDRISIARRLHHARLDCQLPLNICVQINISNETSKSGIQIDEADVFIQELKSFSRLKIRGLMALPAPATKIEQQKAAFAKLRQCFLQLKSNDLQLDTLSMGTTIDMEAAIAEGATVVRIGSAIFGRREMQRRNMSS